jgi:hypothetical protein
MVLGQTKYLEVGIQGGCATMGATTNDWPAAGDPDTTNDLQVSLTMRGGPLTNLSSV